MQSDGLGPQVLRHADEKDEKSNDAVVGQPTATVAHHVESSKN